MENKKIVYVNPVPRQPVQGYGRHNFVVDNGTGATISVGMNRTKAFNKFGSPDEHFMFPINHTTGRLVTGLDDLMLNPFKGEDVDSLRVKYSLPPTWTNGRLNYIIDNPSIPKQSYYEIIHSVDYDYYTSQVKSGTVFSTTMGSTSVKQYRETALTYLQTFKYSLGDRPNRIVSGSPRNDLVLELIKVHPAIANTKYEINSAIHRFFISEENAERSDRLASVNIYNNAVYELVLLTTKHSPFTIYKVATLLTDSKGVPVVRGEVSLDTLLDRLNIFVHTQDKNKQHNLTKFLDVMTLVNSKENKEVFDMKYLLQQAINTKVISINSGWYIWHSKYEQPNLYKLNTNLDKVVQFFIDEKSRYNPKATDTINSYGDLVQELTEKNVRLK